MHCTCLSVETVVKNACLYYACYLKFHFVSVKIVIVFRKIRIFLTRKINPFHKVKFKLHYMLPFYFLNPQNQNQYWIMCGSKKTKKKQTYPRWIAWEIHNEIQPIPLSICANIYWSNMIARDIFCLITYTQAYKPTLSLVHSQKISYIWWDCVFGNKVRSSVWICMCIFVTYTITRYTKLNLKHLISMENRTCWK